MNNDSISFQVYNSVQTLDIKREQDTTYLVKNPQHTVGACLDSPVTMEI